MPRFFSRASCPSASGATFILAAALVCICATSASAGTGAIGWTQNSTVKKLVVTGDGGIDVLLSPALSGCVSHSNYGPAFASVLPSHPGLKQIKADLLTAFVTGTPIALYLGDTDCNVSETILGGW
jgi:hypothetical protein